MHPAIQNISSALLSVPSACHPLTPTQYYRVYSPVTFGKKYDPEGHFIRRFVPQLEKFPAKYIYEPWTAPKEVQQR